VVVEAVVSMASEKMTGTRHADDAGFFIGDYEGLDAMGAAFVPFIIQTNSGNTANRTDVFAEQMSPRFARGTRRRPDLSGMPERLQGG
jgi:hypothetical protein